MALVIQSVSTTLYVNQGLTYYKNFVLKNSAGVIVDLTDYILTFQVKQYSGVLDISCVSTALISSATIGEFNLNISDTETNKLVHTRYVYQVVASNGLETVKIMHGQVYIEIF